MSYGQKLVHGEGTSSSRVGPYRFCSDGNSRTLSYLVLSDTPPQKERASLAEMPTSWYERPQCNFSQRHQNTTKKWSWSSIATDHV